MAQRINLNLQYHSAHLPCRSPASCWGIPKAQRTHLQLPAHALKLPESFPRIVDSISRRGDVMIPEYTVFTEPRGAEITRLIFPGGHVGWPGVVLIIVAVAASAEATLLITGRIKHGANPPVPDVPRARLHQQGQQTVSTEERHLDRDAKDRHLAADFQQQLINDGWGDWGGIDSSVDVPPSPVAVGGSDSELSADIGFDPIGLQPPHADADSVAKWAAQHDDWERHHLSRDMHDERGRGLLWLAGVTLVALWATGILSLPAHDPLDASA